MWNKRFLAGILALLSFVLVIMIWGVYTEKRELTKWRSNLNIMNKRVALLRVRVDFFHRVKVQKSRLEFGITAVNNMFTTVESFQREFPSICAETGVVPLGISVQSNDKPKDFGIAVERHLRLHVEGHWVNIMRFLYHLTKGEKLYSVARAVLSPASGDNISLKVNLVLYEYKKG